ncbi:MAG: hypothetical protein DMG04_02135 [Acidobacteria bacterium]|nr:MAG: hypothetical protein DMG04_02135 [Acidobacteriota bacterium]PYQ78564.1 MAG: hypothetical protein DMG03_27990 [Acidobacteriota bacterium]PYQ86849.1 MAG: hypothetical protein DMG02_24505 [Acidobacteriota bacterium]PYR13708.1 MAG: hypothetical protein DMF99_00710 [Acidobacteriota bacterium]
MERRVRAGVAAILWATLIGLPAAQTGIPKGTQLNPGRVTPGAGNFVVIGCVSREGQNTPPMFVITDSRSKPPARYRLDGDADLLRMHVGHTVEIGGPITPASGTRGGANASSLTLTVLSLTYISTTCLKLQ